jgi:palmitoyltransferase
MKWSDWQAEMTEGFAFKRELPSDRQKDQSVELAWTRWPVESEQIVVRTEDGLPPRGQGLIGVGEWQRVWKLADVENLYDLGFWDNFWDVFWPRYGFHHRAANGNQETQSCPTSPAGAGVG